MTKENARKNYEHYLEVGKEDVAEQILEKYPEFEEKVNKCDKCEKSFDSKKGLKVHKSQVHEE